MQILFEFHSLTMPSLAFWSFILIATLIRGVDVTKQLEIQEHSNGGDNHDDGEYHIPTNQIKCPMQLHSSEQEAEPESEVFEEHHMNDHLQQNKKQSKMVKNNIKMMDERWQMISNQLNRLDESWPNLMKHIESKGDHILEHQLENDFSTDPRKTSTLYYEGPSKSVASEDSQAVTPKQLLKNQDFWHKLSSYFPSGLKQVEKNSDNRKAKISTGVPKFSAKKIINTNFLNEKHQIDVGAEFASSIKQAPSRGASSIKSDQIQETIVNVPPPAIKHDKFSELDQQNHNRWMEPVMLHIEEQVLSSANKNAQQELNGEVRKSDAGREKTQSGGSNEDREEIGFSDRILDSEPPASQRVRNSLLKAADIARQIGARQILANNNNTYSSARSNMAGSEISPPLREPTTINSTTTTTRNNEDVSYAIITENTSPSSVINVGGQIDPNNFSDRAIIETTTANSLPPESSWENILREDSQQRPRFLGFGDIQKNEPLNGRVQARLSCQFGDDLMKNVTISKVEWARFVGSYDRDQAPFECQDSFCNLIPVQTDTLTTIHPRPEKQNYLNTRVPSYSVTLHQVDDRNYGVYRCSAIRQSEEGKSETVYRVIALD